MGLRLIVKTNMTDSKIDRLEVGYYNDYVNGQFKYIVQITFNYGPKNHLPLQIVVATFNTNEQDIMEEFISCLEDMFNKYNKFLFEF